MENIQDLMVVYGPLQAKLKDLNISYQYDPDVLPPGRSFGMITIYGYKVRTETSTAAPTTAVL